MIYFYHIALKMIKQKILIPIFKKILKSFSGFGFGLDIALSFSNFGLSFIFVSISKFISLFKSVFSFDPKTTTTNITIKEI